MTTKKAVSKKTEYFEAVGRRKTSVARVRLFDNEKNGSAIVNGKELKDYFPQDELRQIATQPLEKTNTGKNFHLSAKVSGGGIRSQAEALRHGVSRALLKFDQDMRLVLKPEGFLTRDARIKERRKFGLKKARKAKQWSKR